jgi:hypothetical protein
MTTKKSDPDDRFEPARVKRARTEIEETVQGLRGRREPSAFAVEYAPEQAAAARAYQEREERRIADERAGRPTKLFSEMDEIEVLFAMASYPGPGHYPLELETIAQEMAERPAPELTAAEQEALGEVIGLGQRVQAGEREEGLIERLSKLAQHPSSPVRFAAMGLWFQLAEEARSERPTDRPTDPRPDERQK